jgi:hypothetical protein
MHCGEQAKKIREVDDGSQREETMMLPIAFFGKKIRSFVPTLGVGICLLWTVGCHGGPSGSQLFWAGMMHQMLHVSGSGASASGSACDRGDPDAYCPPSDPVAAAQYRKEYEASHPTFTPSGPSTGSLATQN